MPLEDYFARGFQVGTTHGICPECLKKAKEDTTRFFRRKGARVEAGVEESEPSGH